jgi:hypothetical protein
MVQLLLRTGEVKRKATSDEEIKVNIPKPPQQDI